MIKYFQYLVLGLVLTSCAANYGTISTNVIESDFECVDMAIGMAERFHFLGFGNSSKDALMFSAKKDLINSHPLGTNEQYVNYTVDFKTSYWLIINKTKVVVTADVIKIGGGADQKVYSQKYQQKIASVQLDSDLFEVGDSVMIKDKKVGTIISVETPNLVTVAYSDRNGDVVTKKVSVNRIYSINKNYNGRIIGENTSFSVKTNNKAIIVQGVVIAIGLKGVLVKTPKGHIEFSPYDKKN